MLGNGFYKGSYHFCRLLIRKNQAGQFTMFLQQIPDIALIDQGPRLRIRRHCSALFIGLVDKMDRDGIG